MAGIDNIINIIESEQKQNSQNIISSAENKAKKIRYDGDERADQAYREYIKKSEVQSERDYENACNSINAEMKRRLLAFRVELINDVIERTIQKLHNLHDKDYFSLLENIASGVIRKGEGVISLNSSDLKRVTPDFEKNLNSIAVKKGGTLKLSKTPADIEDGFIVTYGLISENCSFREIVETDKDNVRDTITKVLFTEG